MENKSLNTAIDWLGYSPEIPEFDKWLTAKRIYERPHTPSDDADYDHDRASAFENAESSLIEQAEHLGICFIYIPRADYERIFGEAFSKGDFILKELVFYGYGVQGYKKNQEKLPCDLAFGMDRNKASELLGQSCGSRIVHELQTERYLVSKQLMINLSYIDNKLSIVHLRPLHVFDNLEFEIINASASLPKPAHFRVSSLLGLLGCSAHNLELNNLTKKIGWSSLDIDMSQCHEIDELMQSSGLTLYYRQGKQYSSQIETSESVEGETTFFSGFRLNRSGDMQSDGFFGEMPFDLKFHDSPQSIRNKVGVVPDKHEESEDTGFFMWRLNNMILHTMYSLIDLQLYRITIFSRSMSEELGL